MELGGNAPLIVFESADIDKAVDGTMSAKFSNAGQSCMAANCILIHKSIYSQFLEKLAAKVSRLKVGNGLDKGVNMGPLVNEKAFKKVTAIVDGTLSLNKSNVEMISDYKDFNSINSPFHPPTLLSCHENSDVPVFHKEIFGPVAALFSFSTESEAVEMANNTRYALQAYIFTKNLSQAWRVSENLEYGIVAVNEGAIRSPNNPHGGWKESGIGREAGHLGIDEFTEDKTYLLWFITVETYNCRNDHPISNQHNVDAF